ncbi:MAG: plasmid replication initiator protein [Actinomycetota bacterium]|nr:plasmid replication initiator protein [Actinomycetota bacterium]
MLWNALASDLWRRTTIEIRRSLARSAGITEKVLRESVRLSCTKVVEYQQRGSIHLHAVIRLDQRETDLSPEAPFDAVLLAASVWQAARAVRAPQPTGSPVQGDARWGQQLEVHDLSRTGPGVAAAYLAKYATKSTDPAGHLDHRLRAGDIDRLDDLLSPHLAWMVRTAWDLGADPSLEHLGLRRWAHTLGFRGHWLTKSRSYSTTFTALRTARRLWHGDCDTPMFAVPGTKETADWIFTGRDWLTPGDALLADSAASDRAAARRAAWEER